MRLHSVKMVSPRPHEDTSLTGDTVALLTTDVGSSTIPAVSTAYAGPILTPRQPQMPMHTMGISGQYMPNFTVSIHRTLGMPTEFMASMHDLGSTFGEASSSPFQRYQGLGPFDNPIWLTPRFWIIVSVGSNFHVEFCRSHKTTDGRKKS